MIKSDNIEKLVVDLIKVQQELGPITKDAINPFFKSGYITLTKVWGTVRETVNKHGFAVSQVLDSHDGKPVLTTILMHESGQFLAGDYPLVPVKDDPQGYGSAITYARRYGLCSILSIVADEDDDGNQASKPNTRPNVTTDTQHPRNQPTDNSFDGGFGRR